MTKPDAWMPFYPGDYLADTRRLTLDQHGAYLLLILDYWRNGPPPDDELVLARIVGCQVSAWRRLAPAVRCLFRAEGGFLRHKRIDSELEKATARKGKAVAKAEIAAAARWAKQNASSNAPSMQQALHEQCPPPSPSSVPTEQKAKPSRKKPDVPIPADFGIDPDDVLWATSKGYGDLRPYLEIFVGRNLASGKLYANWKQAFRNAVLEDWYGLRKVSPATAKQSARDAVAAQIFGATNERTDERVIDGEVQRVA